VIKRGIGFDATHAARDRRFGLASERAVTTAPAKPRRPSGSLAASLLGAFHSNFCNGAAHVR
jgi:hypothetical protein